MRSSLRVISTLGWALHSLGFVRWILGIMALLSGAADFQERGAVALVTWVLPAVAMLVLGELVQRVGYTFFLPDPGVGAAPAAAAPWDVEAVASGHFRTRRAGRFGPVRLRQAVDLKVYWCADMRPPGLALVNPWLAENQPDPFSTAITAGLWHPGVEVTAGWAIIGWRCRPGVKLRFIGKQAVVGFAAASDAAAVVQVLLRNDCTGVKTENMKNENVSKEDETDGQSAVV